jgi:pyruvate/2-oxoglutarate dehydrogenase complex dihydrolipoamide acyltransferase (E2) component
MSEETPAIPKVRATARRLGVDLSTVNGTGHGGMITVKDVKAAASKKPLRRAPAATAPVRLAPPRQPTPRGGLIAVADTAAIGLADELGVYLGDVAGTGEGGAITVDDVRAAAGQARSTDPAPLPAFTASGLDPQELLKVPAPVRPAVAAAETRTRAYELAQAYAGMSDDEAREALAADPTVPAHVGGAKANWPS